MSEDKTNELIERLTEKSIEAFICSIEVYNKPTIKYRVEGFSFFICNAWELMLKAFLIKKRGEESIYYKDNPDRTRSLSDCISILFTNDKDPLRINIEKILDLRNTSTHFITQEYEMVYVPLFQACVINYSDKMMELLSVDIRKHISQNFLQLSVDTRLLNEEEIRAKYPDVISSKLIKTTSEIFKLEKDNNEKFSIKIDYSIFITKKRDEASAIVGIDNNVATDKIKIVKDFQNPNTTHKYNASHCVEEIRKRLQRDNIQTNFNMNTFGLFTKYYGMKENKIYCFVNTINKEPSYSYSALVIDFIVEEIKKNPIRYRESLKNLLSKVK